MKTPANYSKQPSMPNQPRKLATLIAVATAALMLTACASEMKPSDGAVAARNKLTSLQGNNNLASRAPVEIRDADVAVRDAEQSKGDRITTEHLVTVADQKVDIASAWAQSRFYEDQRKDLSAQSEAARLEARTREADRARSDAASARSQATIARNDANLARSDTTTARTEAAAARSDADAALTATAAAQDRSEVARNDANVARTDASNARNETDLARQDTAAARAGSADLQRQIDELNATKTDRGLVVTLGDVLFETGKSDLHGGAPDNLNKLAAFLNRYETRTAMIEGHTDNVGTEDSNLGLSQRRAAAVQSYLVNRGVNANRITAAGEGETSPIASNDTATGRQQNRRVEVIISNATR